LVVDLENLEFLVIPTGEHHTAIPVHTRDYRLVFLASPSNMLDRSILILLLALCQIIFLLIKIILHIHLLLPIPDLRPILQPKLLLIKVFQLPLVLSLGGLFGQGELLIGAFGRVQVQRLLLVLTVMPELLAGRWRLRLLELVGGLDRFL
jgi:hypothetical protein